MLDNVWPDRQICHGGMWPCRLRRPDGLWDRRPWRWSWNPPHPLTPSTIESRTLVVCSALLLPSPHLCLSLLLFTLEHKHFPPSSLFNPASIAVSPCLVSSALISTTWEEVKAAAFGLLVSSLPPFLFPVFTSSLARRLQGPSIFSVNLSLLAAYSERGCWDSQNSLL